MIDEKYKKGDKVLIPYYFKKIKGIIVDYKNSFYTIEAEGKSFPFITKDKITKL